MYVCNTLAPLPSPPFPNCAVCLEQININLIHGGGGGVHPPPFNSFFRPPAPSLLIIYPQPSNYCPFILHYLRDIERL